MAAERVNLVVLSSFALLASHSILANAFAFDTLVGVLPFWVSIGG